ncbi:MAG: FAD-dependent oxidoreductase [Saprospiraceae bacterium]
MQRRNFMIKSLRGLPLVFFASSILNSSCSKDDMYEEIIDENGNIVASRAALGKSVIVIGAGISGLAAAKKLKEAGYTVKVLESQEKVGGRLRTDRSLGIPFDEGASWIHGVNGNPLTSLAQSAGMTTFHTNDNSFVTYDIGGVKVSDSKFSSAESQFYNMLETLMKKGSSNKSFETVFKAKYPSKVNDRLWRFFLSTYLTFDTGDLNKLSSTLYYEGEEYGGVEKIATNGYDTIPNYLATGLNVILNQRVSKVDYSGTKVKVTHNGTISEADYVIVTVPLGVLKANKINFTPALPAAKQTAIQKLGMNCVNKFLLVWDTAFWGNEQYIAYTPVVKDKFNYFVNVKKYQPNVNALMTFAYADYARQSEQMSDTQIINDIMAHLRDIYGSNIPNPRQMLRTKWNSNENTLGSYSYTAVGSKMSHFSDLAKSVNNKIFFAGEHTNIDYFSTAHGAYLSGIREASKIIAL